jgi:2-polyprenyl-6-methoxyphenol hydroxylase-like FAD-dependent oxidoreductase
MTANRSDAGTNSGSPVLIAGAGIGGLAAALALAQRGIATRVLEQRAGFEPDGAGIQIGPNGTRILQQLGVAEALRRHVGEPRCICVRDGASGDVLTRLPLGDWIATRHGAPYWVAHRRDLHTALLQAVQANARVTLQMNVVATGAAGDERGVTLSAENGDAFAGSALIAADGVWSRLRSAVFDCPAPRFSGKSAARSVLAMDSVPAGLRELETTIWLLADAHVVHYPVSGGNELAIVAIVADDSGTQEWSTPVQPSWLAGRMPPCAKLLRDLIAAAPSWRKWALQTATWPRAFASGRIALLGDAAHPVMPFLAQGGVLALEDGAVLAAELSAQIDDAAAALANYSRKRLPRAVRVAEASRRNGVIYHHAGLLARARNAVLRSAPPERLMARYDWLYGWRAT